MAALCRFLNIWAFLVLVLASLVRSLSFNLSRIGPLDGNVRIKVEGDASITTQGIQLTPYERNLALNSKAGRAMYVDSLHLWDKATGELADFTTNFTFNIDSGGNTSFADGLAFFLANFSTEFNKTATAGGGLGLVDPALVTSPEPVVAVVFDTFSSQENKPLTNVSINVNSMKLPATSIAWLNNITEGMDNTAHITYSASSKFLRVVFTGFWNGDHHKDSLSYEVDLRDYLPEFVSIGFSAATGFLFEKQTVSSWQFDSTPLRSDSVSASPAPSPSKPAPTSDTVVVPEEKSSKKGVVIGLSIGVLILVVLLALAIYTCFKKKWVSKGDNLIILGQAIDDNQNTIGRAMDGEFEKAGSGAKKFLYSELATATNSFSDEQKLGEGGFGGVYLGILRGMKVAVKRVSRESKQGMEEYASEVKIISRLRHRNLVPRETRAVACL